MAYEMNRSKYRNVRKTVDGISFASGLEAKRYSELKLLERAGEIRNLERQVPFKFVIDGRPVLIKSKGYPKGRQAKYTVDFAYFDVKTERRRFEEVKGRKTTDYSLRRAIVEAMFPGVEIVEIR